MHVGVCLIFVYVHKCMYFNNSVHVTIQVAIFVKPTYRCVAIFIIYTI